MRSSEKAFVSHHFRRVNQRLIAEPHEFIAALLQPFLLNGTRER